MNKVITVLLAISIILSATGLATATSIVPDEEIKIFPAGTCEDFTLTVTPSATENAYLGWASSNTDALVWIEPPGYTGTTTLTGTTSTFSVTQSVSGDHLMKVCLSSSANGEYPIWVEYFGDQGGRFRLRAVAEPVAATPELPTTALMSIGLLGLFGLVSMKRRKV